MADVLLRRGRPKSGSCRQPLVVFSRPEHGFPARPLVDQRKGCLILKVHDRLIGDASIGIQILVSNKSRDLLFG